ncbi:MAG: hypothetical protein EWV53_00805 [Microcystis panniformis Mp_MB_F_20051200_S9]|uniref:Uncharacterized protein n=1 Tax=Microcystis panniformis Mp_MB_F_20051200_S9 TaxID=2486223 RepID=A0A552QAX2_9CHRO|nr:MAG: hypothetical protein EWV87_09560 [Microcystis panniformis Mp_GB_SS_20050300_S99]TRV51491.1 MAG: hypothetical protein EWV42_09820 [Microcystis panniformis Mp_GB_SS_20050300_S99D]TRV51983.1 MAG: hypothetical protein EWV43_03175 [Microcystis panniformis Mp_MB_F_20080800_S26D]TRV56588.1 MAG: hypothetical protein EWV86_22405 [Microcystis panniformis Mp_MB_F_20051200_S9D]TRV61454.1 MAG: hypothetical protein EWV69_07695 [Microcystis panniformis Mp_MB_F_20080800_S26]TRV66354.1 MAG: hypothetica
MGLGDRIQESGFRRQDSGFRSQDSGFRRLFLFIPPTPYTRYSRAGSRLPTPCFKTGLTTFAVSGS